MVFTDTVFSGRFEFGPSFSFGCVVILSCIFTVFLNEKLRHLQSYRQGGTLK